MVRQEEGCSFGTYTGFSASLSGCTYARQHLKHLNLCRVSEGAVRARAAFYFRTSHELCWKELRSNGLSFSSEFTLRLHEDVRAMVLIRINFQWARISSCSGTLHISIKE